MQSESVMWPCPRCGDLFERQLGVVGAAASWCAPCRRQYAREYMHRERTKAGFIRAGVALCQDCGAVCKGVRCRPCHLAKVKSERKTPTPKAFGRPKGVVGPTRRPYTDKRYLDLREIVLAEETHCGICHQWVDRSLHGQNRMAATIDHIVPLNAGGAPFDRANVRLAHRVCNSKAGNAAKSYRERERVGLVRAALWIGERLSA